MPSLLRALLPAMLLVASADGAHAIRAPHTDLKRSEPAKDSRLATPPTRISLWFTGKPQLAFTRIRLVTPSGDIPLDTIAADTGNALHARIPRVLGPGIHRVIWQTASADGHPIRGEFAFVILGNAAAAGTAPVTSVDPAPANDPLAGSAIIPESPSEYRSARWMEFVALLTILGVFGFRHGVLPPLASRGVPTADAMDRALRIGRAALILYAIAAMVRVYSESAAINTPESALTLGAMIPMLTTTTWGIGWSLGILGAAFVALGWSVARWRVAVGTPLALSGALGMVLAPALSGHAAASEHFVISVTLDMLHVAAAGIWLGGLVIVVVAGIPSMRRLTDGNPDAAVSALVNSFHPLALFCAPVVVAAGLGTSVIRLGSVRALTSTVYGQTLLWKVACFAVVMALAAYNASRVRRQLGTPGGTTQIRRSSAVELVMAAIVLAITTMLVTTPVPADMAAP